MDSPQKSRDTEVRRVVTGRPQVASQRWFVRLFVLAVPVLLVSLAARPAFAYPVEEGNLSVVAGTLAPGDSVTISGGGFTPGTSVSIDVSSQTVHLTTVLADGAGLIRATVTIPDNLSPGVHHLLATGQAPDGATLVLSVSFTVGGLPVTGDRISVLVVRGGLLLLFGLVICLVAMAGRQQRQTLADDRAVNG